MFHLNKVNEIKIIMRSLMKMNLKMNEGMKLRCCEELFRQ